MANRSYPPFGKVKTIVLPVPTDELTYSQYKQKYGIDLKDVFEIDADYYINFKNYRNSNILFDFTEVKTITGTVTPNLIPVGCLPSASTVYDEGAEDGKLEFFQIAYSTADEATFANYVIKFVISKDMPWEIENMTIMGTEW